MKTFLSFALIASMLGSLLTSQAVAAPIGKTPFEKTVYISAYPTSTASAANSGVDYSNPKGLIDGDLWAIPAGTVIEQMFIIVDEAVAGITLFEVGDDDDANDYVASSSTPFSTYAATTGLMYWDLMYKGNYLKSLSSSGGFNAKYYSASGKEVKLNVTGTATTGKVRLVIRGYNM